MFYVPIGGTVTHAFLNDVKTILLAYKYLICLNPLQKLYLVILALLHAVVAVHLVQAVSHDLVGQQSFPLQICAANLWGFNILETFCAAVHIFPIGVANLAWFGSLYSTINIKIKFTSVSPRW